jgi:hypothetical protein
MPNPKKPPTAEVMVTMPVVLKKDLADYARKEMTSMNAVIRKSVRDTIDAGKRKTEK